MFRFGPMARVICASVAAAAAMICWGQQPARAVDLPTCNVPVNCLTFDDFTVYSLALLNTISGTNNFDQKSTPGYLNQNAITIGTGANGVNNNNTSIDNPYDTPNNVPHNTFVNFESVTLTDPSPTFTGDNTVTATVPTYDHTTGLPTGATTTGDIWDATTAALRTFFGSGEQVVFYFNLNESNQGGSGVLNDGQDMYGWLRVTLTDSTGGAQPLVFTLSGLNAQPGGSAAQQATTDPLDPGFDAILPNINDLWAHVHGEICVDSSNQANPFVHFGECVAGDPTNAITVNQNLGADQAAFALFNQQLSDEILNPSSPYDLVSVDLRMAHIDNGFEQLFILPGFVGPVPVPEPGTIAMFGIGLLGLALFLRRRLAI